MLPIGDDNSDRLIFPFVNLGLIALCVLVFVVFQGMGGDQHFTMAWSTVPAEILSGKDLVTADQAVRDPASGQTYVLPGLQPTPVSVYLTLLASMFMHGGIAHLLGNLLYLWIFGDNIENRLGHGRYLLFYLLVGVIASLAFIASTAAFGGDTAIPSLGASGAIAGVLGAYLLLYPKRRVRMLLGRAIVDVPAIAAVGLWFVFQLVAGLGQLGGGSDGVAYAAHIGGFIAGLVLVRPFAAGRASDGASQRTFGPRGGPPGGGWMPG
jgi:membrane associated rhomboid family serine protease